MKIYTREEIRKLLPERNLKGFCNDQGIYYHGLIRFLKGADITVSTYFKILNRCEVTREVNHYLADKIMYSDLAEIDSFLQDIMS